MMKFHQAHKSKLFSITSAVATTMLAVLITWSAPALSAGTKLTWYGHAAFKIVTPSGGVILIDSWLNNPKNPDKEAVSKLDRVDYILLTHGHFDHLGDTVEIGKASGAELVTTFGLGSNLVSMLGYPKDQAGFATLANVGGTIQLPKAGARVTLVAAVHGSELNAKDPQPGEQSRISAGNPVGFVVEIDGGPTIYTTGDTDVTMDMQLIGRLFDVDVMLTNIGGHFNMEPNRAAVAVELVKAKKVVPMHYGTFGVLLGTPAQLQAEMNKINVKAELIEMTPGETREF